MDMPRLMIVSHHFAPSTATSGRRPSRLAEYLTQRGAPPTVVTASRQLCPEAFEVGPSIRDELRVHEVKLPAWLGAGHGGVGRSVSNASLVFAYAATIQDALRKGPRPDFMLFRGVPCWYFPLARYVRLRWRIPYVLDLGDVWYMRGIKYRRGQRSGLRHLIDGPAESWSVNGAALTLLTTFEQTRIYRWRYPHLARSIMMVRWGYDAELLSRVKPEPKRNGLFRVAIVGRFSVYRPEDADTLAQAVAVLSKRRDVEVVHIGRPEPDIERAFVRAGVLQVLRPLGLVPYAQCLAWLKSSDCGVANPLSDVSVPVKVYDYIGANLPILAMAPPGSAMDRMVRRFPGAFVVQDAREATSALVRMMSGDVRDLAPGLDPTEFSIQHQFDRLIARLNALRRKGGA